MYPPIVKSWREHWAAALTCASGKMIGLSISLSAQKNYQIWTFVTFHDKTMHNALTTDLELRPPLPTTTFELLLLQIWSLYSV